MSNSPAKTTSAADWKKKSSLSASPIEVPSGNTALLRVPGVEVFFKQGVIPNNLMPIIQEAMRSGEQPDMTKLMPDDDMDPKMILDILQLVNAVTCYSVVEPAVHSNLWSHEDHISSLCTEDEVGQEIPGHRRDQGVLYVDEVDLEDRMFIMQLAFGGTKDLARFREGLAEAVEPVRPRKDAPKPTKRTGGASKRKS